MPGQTKVVIGLTRIWVYLDDQATKAICAGQMIGSAIAGLIPDPTMASKICMACSAIAGAFIQLQNRGNGIIVKIPFLPGIMKILRPPEICSQ